MNLKYGQDDTRVDAANALGNTGDLRAVDPLIAALNDNYWVVRQVAALSLGTIGDARAVDPLLGTLNDGISSVRGAAALALGDIGESRVINKLTESLGDNSYKVRLCAAGSLVKLGKPEYFDQITSVLTSADRNIRFDAVTALGYTGDSRAIEPLTYIAQNDKDSGVISAATEALDKISKSSIPLNASEPVGNKFVPDAINVIYSTDFENYSVGTLPPGFEIKYNGKGTQYQKVTTDASHSGSKSLQAWGASGWGANIDYYFTMPESGRIGYEVYIKANPKEEGSTQFMNPEGATWGWGWAGIGFDENGNINAPASSTANSYNESQPVGDQWYKVKSEMDVITGAIWIWLNDVLVVDGKTPAELGKENPDAYKGIRAITFNDASWYENPSTPIYIDDFKLYTVNPIGVLTEL